MTDGKQIDHQLHLYEAMKDDKYKQAEMDHTIELLNVAEEYIKDVDWVRDQKKKFKFQQDIARKMNKIKQSRV